ncbi:MAG: hypothetical protein HFH91_14185 [Lachnospiraceae bacterium]|nr:hypothetical protein [Lachnospiraceae bacterium]
MKRKKLMAMLTAVSVLAGMLAGARILRGRKAAPVGRGKAKRRGRRRKTQVNPAHRRRKNR